MSVLPHSVSHRFCSAPRSQIPLIYNVRHHVSQPYKTSGKTAVLYTYFNIHCLDSKQEDKRYVRYLILNLTESH